ncbi:hypothetical protein SD37_09295 [Amycolatopsis orientalis]|uniref:TauD/TfdA-like domain-containing protein n=1 Tax=Amycolatopsis orientalis TaxID=31958 RepID=A0A193CB28_AMYOR|nr:hypothetical protein SD37_09295 [Amycolatopsis orientalis]
MTAAESSEVASLADRTLGAMSDGELVGHLDEVRVASENLPSRLRSFLIESRVTESEIFSVSGLPIGSDLPPTPAGWTAAQRTGAGLREQMVLLLCGSLVGDPFTWATQQNGRLVHDVCPAPDAERSLTSASSLAALSLHTEDVHHACRGDYVALLCLRNPDAVATSVVRADAVALAPEIRRLLREQRFEFHPDDSHTGSGRDAGSAVDEGPVFFGPEERPYVRFDADFVSGKDDVAQDAVRDAAKCFQAATEQLVLEPGEVVFLDNYRVVHGRGSFVPRYDGTDRWLKRVNLARDIRRTYRKLGTRSRVIK